MLKMYLNIGCLIVWRGKPTDKKQGSSEETIEWLDREVRVGSAVRQSSKGAIILYRDMLDAGVAPEQARMVLPQNVYDRMVLDRFIVCVFESM